MSITQACSRALASADIALPGRYLPAGDEDDEFVGLLTPKDIEPAPVPAFEPAPSAANRFGLRLGMLAVHGDTTTWDPALRLGGYYRRNGRSVHEIGAEIMLAEGEESGGGAVSTQIVLLRYDMLLGKQQDDGVAFRVVGGFEIGFETATWELTGDASQRTGGAVNIGMNIGEHSGAWDARVAYSLIPGSDNTSGGILATFGFAF